MPDLKIISGGAAHGLVSALTPAFTAATGLGIAGDFGAVGGMRQRLVTGEQADLVILTAAIMGDLAANGIIAPETVADIGPVATSIAVRADDAAPDVTDGPALRRALLAADAIYFPDPELATAGIHFRSVMERLGILEQVGPRLRPHPNGAKAMAALAAAPEAHPIGCTQATEIVATPGVRLVADLPPEHALRTVYTVGVATSARFVREAAIMARLLTAPDAVGLRQSHAFSV